MLYILDKNKNPVPTEDYLMWGEWMNNFINRVVQQENVGDVIISTVFLGVAHSYIDDKPILFETLVQGGAHDDGLMKRYTTWSEALKGHSEVVFLARGSRK